MFMKKYKVILKSDQQASLYSISFCLALGFRWVGTSI